MTLSPPHATTETAAQPQGSTAPRAPAWYRPTLSHEHGVYVMLFVSFLTGAAAAQQWTLSTTLALASAFAAFQAEHPLVLQIKQRRSWKPRFLVWSTVYTGIALGLAGYLYLKLPLLLWLYVGASSAVVIDALAVLYRQQKSIANELLTFAAVCLAAPFAYIATIGTWSNSVLGLWLLNTLFFSSAIFSVKLRKPKTASIVPGLIYHVIASGIVGLLWYGGWLAPLGPWGSGIPLGLAFGAALFKFAGIVARRHWYQTTPIQNVALLETLSALLFLAIAALALLPIRLY